MTMNEEALIERLIVEAAKRGAVELQLDRAVKAGEEAAAAIEAQKMATMSLVKDWEAAEKKADAAVAESAKLRTDLRRVCLDYDKAIGVLRDLFVAVRTRKSKPSSLRPAMLEAANILESYVPF
jgi:hypothetical protein